MTRDSNDEVNSIVVNQKLLKRVQLGEFILFLVFFIILFLYCVNYVTFLHL